jgi:hypothetical protein
MLRRPKHSKIEVVVPKEEEGCDVEYPRGGMLNVSILFL